MYLVEMDYLREKDFPFGKALEVVAGALAENATYYQARLWDKDESGREQRKGTFPEGRKARMELAHDLVSWLFEFTEDNQTFFLHIHTLPITRGSESAALLGYGGAKEKWFLHIGPEQWLRVQSALLEHELPLDLFYPDERQVFIPYTETSWKDFLGMGHVHHYSPREWKKRQEQ